MAGSGRSGAQDDQVLEALLEGASQREAAARVGVSERTVRRRVADPGFQRRLMEAQVEIVKRVERKVAAATIRAIDTLNAIALDEESGAGVRVNAARALLGAFSAQQPNRVELDAMVSSDQQDSALDKLRALLAEAQQNRTESEQAVATAVTVVEGNGHNGNGHTNGNGGG